MRQPYPNELTHYGILGMKWGVRRYQNADGTLTDAGKKRYASEWKKQYLKDPYAYNKMPKDVIGDNKIRQISKNTSELRKKIEDVDSQIMDVLKDYTNNREEWASVAGAAARLVNDMDNDRKTGMYELAQSIWFFANEDGDQGYMNSVSVWADEHNKTKELDALAGQYHDAWNNYHFAVKDSVNDLLGRYGDERVRGYATAAHTMTNAIVNASTDKLYANYLADEATQGPTTSRERAAVSEAKRIVAALSIGSKGNSTWNIVEAVENAGLENKSFDEMSDADWQRLSKELAALS